MVGPVLWMVVATYPILPMPGKVNKFYYFALRGTLSSLFPPTLCEGYTEMFWSFAIRVSSNRRCTGFTGGIGGTAPGMAGGLFLSQAGFLARIAPHVYGLVYVPPVHLGLSVRSFLSPRTWWGVEVVWRRGEIHTVPGFGRSETLLKLDELWFSGILGTSWTLVAFRVPYHRVAWWGKNPQGMFSLWLDVAVFVPDLSSSSR